MITSKNVILFCNYILFFLGTSVMVFAQSETTTTTTTTTKTTIITKTIDKNGEEKTTEIVTEGDEMSEEELNALIEKTLKEEGVDAEVDVQVDGDGEKMTKSTEKEITIKIKNHEGKAAGATDDAIILKKDDAKMIEWEEKEIKVSDLEEGEEMIIEEEIIEKDGKIEKRIKKIKHGGHAPQGAFLGIMMDGEVEGQVKVTETVEGSAAEKAGLKKGDIIKNVDGKEITDLATLLDALSGKKPQDKVNIAYERDGKIMNTEAILTEHKSEMKVIKKIEMDDMDGEMLWKDEDGKVIELEDGQKMMFKSEDGTKTTTTKKVVKENGKTTKTIQIEVEKEVKEEKKKP